jgi:hypothetical protein
MTTVTHIVPLFAPVIDGVGDYALKLAQSLRREYGIGSRFVVCDPTWVGPDSVDDFPVVGPKPVGDRGLDEALRDDRIVILHYVGYAYHPKGIPRWLVETLAEWQRYDPEAALITIFHEIWSSGPPWKSAFFLRPTQRSLIAQLLKQSRHAFVSTRSSLQSLNGIAPNKASFLPVSANVIPLGEPASHPRGSELFQPLIFGQPWTRRSASEQHLDFLRALHANRRLGRIFVMGKGASRNPACEDVALLKRALPSEEVTVLGETTVEEAARIFNEADFLLSPVRPRDFCKSSAVMSAFACSCPVAVPLQFANDDPAPLSARHFIIANDSDCHARYIESSPFQKWNLQRVAMQARSWFLEHADWPVIAAVIAEKLRAFSNPQRRVEK